MIRNASRAVMATAIALGLSGCISIGPKPPPSLLTLTPTASAPAGMLGRGTSVGTIAINEPDAPARLAVTRVPVQVDDSNVAYLEDAVWVENPARLFRHLLAETVRTRSNRVVLDGGDPPPAGTARLDGTLREFGYDARSSSVMVRFDAMRRMEDGALQTRRFEASVPGVAPEVGPVGTALNIAANQVAVEIADWIG